MIGEKQIGVKRGDTNPTYLFVVHKGLLDLISDGVLHEILDLQHPVFHIPLGVDVSAEGHILPLPTVHARDLQVTLELKFGNILETFPVSKSIKTIKKLLK